MNDNQMPSPQMQAPQQQPVPSTPPEQPKVESKAGSLIDEIRKESAISRLSRAGISFISFGILASAAFAVFYPGSQTDIFVPELPQTGGSDSIGETLEANNLQVDYPSDEWILVDKKPNYLSFANIPNETTDFGQIPFVELSTVTYDPDGLDADRIVDVLQAERLQLLLQFGGYQGDFATYDLPEGTHYEYDVIKYQDPFNSYTLFTAQTDIDNILVDILVTEPEKAEFNTEAIDRFISEVEISEQFSLPETGSSDLPDLPENRNRNVLLSVLLINLSVGIALILISFAIRAYNTYKKRELSDLIPRT